MLGSKIKDCFVLGTPYMLIIGDKEIEENKVGVRVRGEGDVGQMEIGDFVEKVVLEIKNKKV